MTTLSCPFGHCEGSVEIVVQQKAAGDDETTEDVIEAHQIIGALSRFGGCPASLMRLPLDAYSQDQLEQQMAALDRLIEGAVVPAPAPRPAPPRKPQGRDWFVNSKGGGPGYVAPPKLAQVKIALEPGPHAGPGPGRAQPPRHAGNVEEIVSAEPKGPSGQGAGTTMDNDMRSQLRALCGLAIHGFAQEQEQCSVITGKLDEVIGMIGALSDTQQATHQLAVGAVGMSNMPEPALNMINASLAVGQMLEQITGHVDQARIAVAATSNYAGAAAEHGREYLAVI